MGAVLLILALSLVALVYMQFRGELAPTVRLTVLSPRAGLVLDPGSKVTLDGVPIGRVVAVNSVQDGDVPSAQILVDVKPQYLSLLPVNVETTVTASTVFGNKYVSFRSPPDPGRPVTPGEVLYVAQGSVTTEFNTLFEAVTDIAEKVDPIELNMTLRATATALTGLGDDFGRSLVDAKTVLQRVNPRMPAIRRDIDRLADLADIYQGAAQPLLEGLRDAVTTARTLHSERDSLDAALLAALGFAQTGADTVEQSTPFLTRGQADLTPTAQLLDEYSPALLCTIRNYHDVAPKVSAALGKNGYAAVTATELLGGAAPYIYPDNLPRTNATGGPGGAPGCWQPITRDLWPAPALVMDTGASVAPYNHFELGQPLLNEYVWGRQVGEYTVNP
ncbi:phospholipid/cholesterol/gamma-HCH transport system substrate-binding protein [Mycolicibacterium iranicum]|uniref:Phospholipid/cholesterol/gamma-HCH transport system substrate-binding protein n=1 Tax=Mycolicibacterium iranicum TaxID=912594 RepID=A0A839Q098_MYCIR|nr:MCE family protein [Mycolicibacterium iranicum]MBB2989778.1 phospholipid/cholesterol/gamma-HCH transport system substrate-binding protein [Mycolicibacterium iranicum]